MLKIRKVTGYDREKIDKFFGSMDAETKLYFNRTGKSYKRVVDFMSGVISDELVYIAEFDGEIAGILVICGYDYSVVWISLCVSEEFRRRKIGTTLLRYADKVVLQRGGGGILLSVNKNNTPAIHLYRKEGYMHIGEGNGEFIFVKAYKL